uniref:Folate/pteridine transporter n=1 Tax=Alexandrium catenella TaxID=2925 RepID=A0A7S1RLX8_ALECA
MPEERARSWKSLRLKARSEPGLFALAIAMAAGSLLTAICTACFGPHGRAAVSLVISLGLIWGSYRTMPAAIASANLYMFIISVAYLDLSGPLAYFYTGGPACVENGPHFSYSYYLAVSNVVGSAGAALGAVMFQSMQHWSFRAAFCVTTVIQMVASLFDIIIVSRTNLAWGIPDKAVYLFGDAACQSMAQQMALMPMALLTARLCPRGAEATVFAILAGFQNFGSAVSSIIGVQLSQTFGVEATSQGPCNFENFQSLIVISHFVIPAACLPFTWCLVPSARIDDESALSGTPPPSFASPAPSSAGSSPQNSPRANSEGPDDDHSDHYALMQDSLMQHEDSDPDGFRLKVTRH